MTFFMSKSLSRKIPIEKISVSCIGKKYNNVQVTTPCYPFFPPLSVKVVAVAYEKCSLTRGSKYSDLTWKLLVFCKTGRWWEVVATGGLAVLAWVSIGVRVLSDLGERWLSCRKNLGNSRMRDYWNRDISARKFCTNSKNKFVDNLTCGGKFFVSF